MTDAEYYALVRKAAGRGAPTLLLGTSNRALDRSVERLQQARLLTSGTDIVRAPELLRLSIGSLTRWIEPASGVIAVVIWIVLGETHTVSWFNLSIIAGVLFVLSWLVRQYEEIYARHQDEHHWHNKD
jgi:hypothetical protein